jgi:hypothetical protein
MPTTRSARFHGSATASIPSAAHTTASTSHAGSASESDERTSDHWFEIARTTNTPPATPITMPTAVEILASRARFRRSLSVVSEPG